MKRILISFILLSLLAGGLLFVGCEPDDTTKPRIYFTQPQDTIVLLLTQFEDPGVYVEDNKDVSADIKVESDFEDVIDLNTNGELRRTGIYEITYIATDLSGNTAEAVRTVNVVNVGEIIAGSYDVVGTYEDVPDDNFVSTISADARYAGRVRFSRVYNHEDGDDQIWLRVNAWLYSDTKSLDITNPANEADEYFGWTTTPDNPNEPFFYEIGHTAAFEEMKEFTYLHIPTQNFVDSLGIAEFTIRGQAESDGMPRSKVVYEFDQLKQIELQINVTRSGNTDRITEIYVPR
jgi:hypothetical protein